MMRLERMNSPEVEAYFKDHKIALLSVGSIEFTVCTMHSELTR